MMRWSICLCAVLFAASCASDGGPGTESPGGGIGGTGTGGTGTGGTAGSAGNAGGADGAGMGGVGGAAGQAGAAGMNPAGAGGAAGDVGAGMGGAGGMGGMGGTMGGDDDAGVDDEGYCTAACTGIRPDDDVVEACAMITSRDECTMFETGGFPLGCRWVTPDSEPCLAP